MTFGRSVFFLDKFEIYIRPCALFVTYVVAFWVQTLSQNTVMLESLSQVEYPSTDQQMGGNMHNFI